MGDALIAEIVQADKGPGDITFSNEFWTDLKVEAAHLLEAQQSGKKNV